MRGVLKLFDKFENRCLGLTSMMKLKKQTYRTELGKSRQKTPKALVHRKIYLSQR